MPGYHPGNSHTVITAPIDRRPISIDYLKYLVNMGGDSFYCVDKAYLDSGPTNALGGFNFGNPSGVRSNLASLVSSNNNSNTTVILSTTSYINGGLVASRMPSGYNEVTNALLSLDFLTTNYSNPVYYVFVPMPRTLPDPHYSWPILTDYGLTYFYNIDTANIATGKSIPYNNYTPMADVFVSLLTEWAYVSNKQASGFTLASWENQFKIYFENKYLTSTSAPKYNGMTYLTIYENLYISARDLIKALMDRKLSGKIDELIIGIDDISLPTFYSRNINFVITDSAGVPIKFGWARKYLNEVKSYHKLLYSSSSVLLGESGDSYVINYISGVDEIPQLIYARDLTRRTSYKTNFIVDYSLDKNATLSRLYQGPNDYLSAQDTIKQRINFVTKRGNLVSTARPFRLFVHNWDIDGPMLQNKFNTVPANPYPLPDQAAIKFASTVYNYFYNNNNVGVLDLANNTVDWQLFRALELFSGYSKVQLACYSGWNTAGNAAGLGIAHALVFGVLDYYNATREMWSWHAKLLAQHLLEDGIYNCIMKTHSPYKDYLAYIPTSDYTTVAINTWSRFRSNDTSPDNPGGNAYIMRYFSNPLNQMRLAGTNYTWGIAYVKPNTPPIIFDLINVTGHPWQRTFECIVDTYIW